MQRKIIHVDMDAFYASVEQRDFPEYRGRPLVVGGSPDKRGVVATASYEARRFGIRSAMSSRRAAQLCPEVLFVLPRFDVYKRVSRAIRAIFARYTDLIEPLSLDEAYLDVTVDKRGIGSALDIARQIKADIKNELGLTASAGVSINKFVAKIASDLQKPDGLTFIGPSRVTAFMEQLPVEKFYGVGKVTAEKMKGMNLFTGADLKNLSEQEMLERFGKVGRFYYHVVRGIDDRTVQPHRTLKSMAVEDTFLKDLTHLEDLELELHKLCLKLASRLQNQPLTGRTVTLKIKFGDFSQMTRTQSMKIGICNTDQIWTIALDLLRLAGLNERPVRLLGVSLSNFSKMPNNTNLFSPPEQLRLF
ncbi:DNA polymerase-4 [bacterium A37T11]|nr:DNA polymerase-4 [bacterium A37T11]